MRYICNGYFSSFLGSRVSQEGGLFPMFPFKIVLYSNVRTVFPYISLVHHICLTPSFAINLPLQRKFNYRGLVVPTFPKTSSCPLVPYDISYLFPCSPKPPGHPQYGHIENSHTFYIRRWTHHGAIESICPSLLLSFVVVFLSRVIIKQ